MAFVILALALGQLLRSVSAGAENERRADFLMRATADGQSQMATLGLSLPLVEGETAGRYPDGLLWTLDVARDRALAAAGGPPMAIAYRVRLEIHDRAGAARKLEFVAEKMLLPSPDAAADASVSAAGAR